MSSSEERPSGRQDELSLLRRRVAELEADLLQAKQAMDADSGAESDKVRKLEELIAFAGSIAHEYNNIFTTIIGNLALAKMYAKPGYEVYDVLTEAEKASLRAKDLTSQFLSYATGSSQTRKIVYIQDLFKDSGGLSLLSEPPCELTVQDLLWPVEVDEGQIGLALEILLKHTRQSAPKDGRVSIAVENRVVGNGEALPLTEGSYVVVALTDHGLTLPEEELRSLFTPSASGKSSDSIELATALSIAEKHGGSLSAESRAGTGTTLRLFLPARRNLSTGRTAPAPSGRAGKGTVLVMDDEESVRIVVERLLLQCGFEAELTGDGVEMLRRYRQAREAGRPFQAVILDLIIENGMGGEEAMKSLISYDPAARVVVSSGCANDPVMANFREYGFSAFLPKPFRLEELRRVMNDVFLNE